MSQGPLGGNRIGAGDGMPVSRSSIWALTVIQFFIGGLVLFAAAAILVMGVTPPGQYDGIVSLIGYGLVALVVAVPSMIAAMLIGLPLRIAPMLRSRWLAHGEVPVAGAVLGFVGSAITAAPVAATAGAGSVDGRAWVLLAAWAVFALSIAHFVWPQRWIRSSQRRRL